MGRESCTTHADNTGFFYHLTNLSLGELLIIALLSKAFNRLILMVVLHDDRLNHRTGYGQTLLDCLHGAGHGADNTSRNKSACLSNLLPYQHGITNRYNRLCRSTDVLNHGKYQIPFGKQPCHRLILGEVFSVVRMHSASKCSFSRHVFSSSFINSYRKHL